MSLNKRIDLEDKLQEKRLETEAVLLAMLKDHKNPSTDSLKLYAFQLGLAKKMNTQ